MFAHTSCTTVVGRLSARGSGSVHDMYGSMENTGTHSDAMTRMRFLDYWPFGRRFHKWLVDSPHKGPVMQKFDVLFNFLLIKLLNKQLSYWWFEIPWCVSMVWPFYVHFDNLLSAFGECNLSPRFCIMLFSAVSHYNAGGIITLECISF